MPRKNSLICVVIALFLFSFVFTLPKVQATATSATFYSSLSDGCIQRHGTVYSTVRTDGAGDTPEIVNYLRVGQDYSDSNYYIFRSYVYFDTSSIPDSATILTANLRLYSTGSGVNTEVYVLSGMPTYPHDPLVAGDYDYSVYNSGAGNSLCYAGSPSYQTIGLTSTGISWINKAGWTKFCLRSYNDVYGNEPTGLEEIYFFQADWTGTNFDPKLDITYNEAPVNVGFSLSNPSIGTQGVLAQKQVYNFRAMVSDAQGGTDLNYVDMTLDQGGQILRFRWTESTDAFSEQYDPNGYVSISSSSADSSLNGNQWTLDFKITFAWTYPDESLHTVRLYSLDDNSGSDTDDYSNQYYVENDLTFSGLIVSDYRVNPSQTLTMSGTIYYQGTSISPNDGNYNVVIKLSGVQKGSTDTTLVSGAFSVSDVVASTTVNFYVYTVECTYMASAGSFATVVVDKMKVISYAVSDSRDNINDNVNIDATVKYEYDSVAVTTGTLTINGYSASHQGSGVYRITRTSATVGAVAYNTVAGSESTYILNTVNQNSQSTTVIWDRVVVTISANTTSPLPNAEVSFTITGLYDYDDTVVTSWTHNTNRNETYFATNNFTDTHVGGTLYVYSTKNVTDAGYGLTSFSSTPITIYWSTYVALTIRTLDWNEDLLLYPTVYIHNGTWHSGIVSSGGLYTLTNIVEDTVVSVKVNWSNIWVNGTWSTSMNYTKTIDAKCNTWDMTINARDSASTMLSLSPTTFYWTFPNGTLINKERSDASWVFKVMNGTSYYRIKYQGSWVSANITVVLDQANIEVINKDTWVYSLTAYVTSSNTGLELSGASLTLNRSDVGTLNGLYGLPSSPITSYYNTTHAKYMWSQLANQSSSYTVIATIVSVSGSTATSLSVNKEVVISIAYTPTSGQQGGVTITQPEVKPLFPIFPLKAPALPKTVETYLPYAAIFVFAGIVALPIASHQIKKGKSRSQGVKLDRTWAKFKKRKWYD